MAAHSGCQCPSCQFPSSPDPIVVHHDNCEPCAVFRRQVMAELDREDVPVTCYRIWLNDRRVEYVDVEAETSRQALKVARALRPTAIITGINERNTHP